MNMYDNGEPILEERIEDEEWYPEYQALIMLSNGCENVYGLYHVFLTDYKETQGKEFPNKEQALRWAVLHVERGKNSKNIWDFNNDTPEDMREALKKLLKDGLDDNGYFNFRTTLWDIAGMICELPNAKDDEGGEEPVDFENIELTGLEGDHIILSAGGDWQNPIRMTLEWDKNKRGFVCIHSEPEAWNEDNEKSDIDYLNWLYGDESWREKVKVG